MEKIYLQARITSLWQFALLENHVTRQKKNASENKTLLTQLISTVRSKLGFLKSLEDHKKLFF